MSNNTSMFFKKAYSLTFAELSNISLIITSNSYRWPFWWIFLSDIPRIQKWIVSQLLLQIYALLLCLLKFKMHGAIGTNSKPFLDTIKLRQIYLFYWLKHSRYVLFNLRWCLIFIVAIRHITCASVFTLSSDHATWYGAYVKCEATGQRLAVLDTRKKIEEALTHM